MIPAPFSYRRAGTVEEALDLAADAGEDGKYLAGGHSLLPLMKLRFAVPEVLIDIARIGNDTDTNAAIAGGLLGARDGASAIPQRWRKLLQFGDEFTEAAAVLADCVA